MNNLKKVLKITICCLIIILLSLVFIKNIPYEKGRLVLTNDNDFPTKWTVSIEGGDKTEKISLPFKTKENHKENIISIRNTIPEGKKDSYYLLVGEYEQSFKVYLDNNLIYEFDAMRPLNSGKTGGNADMLVELPGNPVGKEVRIDYISSYKKSSGSLLSVKYGNKDDLVNGIFSYSTLRNLVIITILIMIIFFILVVEIQERKKEYFSNNICIVLMDLCILAWIVCETNLYQFICNNYVLAYYVKYISLNTFPIFAISFLKRLYVNKDEKVIDIIFYIYLVYFILVILGQFTGLMVFSTSVELYVYVFFIIFTALVIYFALLAKNKKISRKLFLIIVVSYIGCLLNFYGYMSSKNKIIVICLEIELVVIGIMIALNVYKSFMKLREEESKNVYLNIQLNKQLNYYLSLEDKNKELRRFRHDMNNHWMIMNRLLLNNKIEEAIEYSSKMHDAISSQFKDVFNTGNPILDAILTEKIQKAKSLNIDVEHEILMPKNIKINAVDFCAIFANIFDNAIEACMKLEENRYIKFSISSKNNLITCKVRNSIKAGSVKENYETTKENKEEHGLGLESIKRAIKKYDGYVKIESNDDWFEIAFVLYNV